MTKTKKWVTIAIRGDDVQALATERELQAAGIQARLLSDVNEPHTVAFHWAPRAVLGGTAVQVAEGEVREACELLGVLTPEEETERDRDERGPDEGDADTDRDARLALALAVIGFFICPGIAQVGSLVTCKRLWSLPLGARARTQVRLALVVNLAVIAAIVATFVGLGPR